MNIETVTKDIVFFIDDKEFKTEQHHQSVKAILVDFARQEHPGTRLARRQGNELLVYEDAEEIIHIENGTKFLTERVSKEVIFFIDKEKFKIDEHKLSVKTLLVDFAKEDPTQTTLARREGNELIKYTVLDEIIHIKNETHFVVLHNSPTPVS
jgi:hypothetical protein